MMRSGQYVQHVPACSGMFWYATGTVDVQRVTWATRSGYTDRGKLPVDASSGSAVDHGRRCGYPGSAPIGRPQPDPIGCLHADRSARLVTPRGEALRRTAAWALMLRGDYLAQAHVLGAEKFARAPPLHPIPTVLSRSLCFRTTNTFTAVAVHRVFREAATHS